MERVDLASGGSEFHSLILEGKKQFERVDVSVEMGDMLLGWELPRG